MTKISNLNPMRRTLSTVLFLALGVSAMAQTGQQFSLKQAQEYALQNSNELKNAQLDAMIADKKVREVTALGLPQVNAEGSFQNFLKLPTTVIPAQAFNPAAPADATVGVQFGTEFNTTGSITASQLIFDGSYIVGLQASKAFRSLSGIAAEKTKTEIKDAVIQAYYTVLVAGENKVVLDSTLSNMEKLYGDTRKIYDNGLIEEQDVDQLELTVANMKNSVTIAERQLDVAYKMLKLQMGFDINQPIQVTDNIETLVSTIDVDALVNQQFSPENNYDYKLLQTQHALNGLTLKNEKAAFLPSLNGFFQHQQQNLSNNFALTGDDAIWFPSTLWGLNLKVPIFSSGMRLAKVSQAKLEMEKSQNDLTRVNQGLLVQAAAAKSSYKSAYEIFNTNRKSLGLAERIQNKTLVKYKEGISSSMDLTQAQNQYLSAQGSYINSMLDLLNAKAALDKILNNHEK